MTTILGFPVIVDDETSTPPQLGKVILGDFSSYVLVKTKEGDIITLRDFINQEEDNV